MPGGRPKSVIPPCRHCSKQFRRHEHLLRHERTRTHEKPFACDCGQSFTRQDLLARHTKLSHQTRPCISPRSSEAAPAIYGNAEMGLSEPDIFWDPNFMAQDMLPAVIFDTDFQFIHTPPVMETPRICNLSRFSSQLPHLDDPEEDTDQPEEGMNVGVPWFISESCYKRFHHELQEYSGVLPPECTFLSRSNLTRYLEKYLVCIQEFLPFIHVATFSVEKVETELLLAMAAHGALYLFEHFKSYELYFMAKAIVLEKARREDLQCASDLLSEQNHSIRNQTKDMEKIQTFVLLISFASWGERKISRDALSMGSQLSMLVRESGISEPDEMSQDIDWLSWVAVEKRRRTLLSAYVIFSLHSIAFDTPPLILNDEVGISLPGYAEQWKAKNATEWKQNARQIERPFKEGLRALVDGTGIARDASVSSFSNYLLIHALLQQIYIDRHGAMGSLPPETIKSFETSLRNWQSCFERGDEPSLNPLTPKGAFGLTGAALLRLAYIRLNSELGPGRGLLSRNAQCMIRTRSNLSRSQHLDRAVLHAAHALSIPVRLGIPFMARTKTPIWSIEHSLCSLECALLLKDWLEMMSRTVRSFGIEAPTKVESKLLGIITGIIKESTFAEAVDIFEDDASRYQRMAGTVVKLWAQIFQGAHILDIDNTIGTALQLLADTPSPS